MKHCGHLHGNEWFQIKNHKYSYKPLPKNVTIKSSNIEGLGLFSTEVILTGTDLGVSHVILHDYELIRTGLGSWVNHNENPNCVIQILGNKIHLIVAEAVDENTELTLDYNDSLDYIINNFPNLNI